MMRTSLSARNGQGGGGPSAIVQKTGALQYERPMTPADGVALAGFHPLGTTMTTLQPRFFGLAAISLALACLGGCANRAIHMVELSGDRALEKGDCALAEKEYAEVVKRDPARPRARLQYGKALLCVGKPYEAREQLENAYTGLPKDDEVIVALATAMAESRDLEGAVRFLRSVAEDRRRPEDYLRLGQFLQKANDIDGAEAALLAAAKGDGGYSLEPQMALAELYRSIGNDDAAIDRLRMCYYLSPQNLKVQQMIRSYGEIPGPTFGRPPAERMADAPTGDQAR